MSSKARGRRNASTSARRRQWFMIAAGLFACYCMFWLRVRLWFVTSQTDVRANVVSVDRDPVDINRSTIKLGEERKQRTTREEVKAAQPSGISQPMEPFSDQVEVRNEVQNLRVVAPLSTPDTAVVIATQDSPVTAVADRIVSSVTTRKVISSSEDRHDVVSGYDAAMKYLANYKTPKGSDEQLFLFFMCGDEQGQHRNWRSVCVDASQLVYKVFTTSPSRNRLLTIYTGSRQDWSTPNAFVTDGDLKVKMVPAIMQWHGGGPGAKRATSGMILEQSLLYEPLVRYLFKNEDIPDPLLAPEKVASKELVLLKGYKSYRSYMDTIAAGGNASLTAPTGPMFLFFIAGRLESNDRPWCPYCRYSEISVEYAYYAFAPEGSRLVKVETVSSYSIWKNRAKNEWKQDTNLMLRGVPWMYRATLDTDVHTFSYVRYQARFDHPEDLRAVFQGWRNHL